jgi:hypothetical protein
LFYFILIITLRKLREKISLMTRTQCTHKYICIIYNKVTQQERAVIIMSFFIRRNRFLPRTRRLTSKNKSFLLKKFMDPSFFFRMSSTWLIGWLVSYQKSSLLFIVNVYTKFATIYIYYYFFLAVSIKK